VCDDGTTNGAPDPQCSRGTVNVRVTAVNDAPTATGENYVTISNTALNVAAPGVLGNDTDIDGGTLSAQLVSNVSHGSLTLNSNGSFSYTPSLDYTDSFTYTAFDGSAQSNVVTVNITVNDTVGPYLNSSVASPLISSVNHKLYSAGLTASATDNGGGPVTIQVAVFGDEDDQTPTNSGEVHSPDAKNIAPGTLRLRGERVESNNGRVYLIIVTATDSLGNVTRNYHSVVVPKTQSQANINSALAQGAAAVTYAQTHGGVPPPNYFVIGDGPIIGPKQYAISLECGGPAPLWYGES
jgi:VCBS repeat-containing protein